MFLRRIRPALASPIALSRATPAARRGVVIIADDDAACPTQLLRGKSRTTGSSAPAPAPATRTSASGGRGAPAAKRSKRESHRGGDHGAPAPQSSSGFPVRVEVPGGVPIYLYTDDVDDQTRTQLENLAKSKMPVGYISAMPDVHLGKGATIGSVFASREYVCPNAVGVDIGCGMCAVPIEGPLMRRDLPERKLVAIQKGLTNSIPTGMESHGKSTSEMDTAMKNLLSNHKTSSWLRQIMNPRHTRQLGTLGGGNHFVELVYDEEDRVWMMLHSGSRNIGNVTARHYDEVAARQCGGRVEALAYLKIRSTEGQQYLNDMSFCQSYALENRRFMMKAFDTVMKRETGKCALWKEMVNIHHNYCECEECRYFDEDRGEWSEERLWVTRKGATSAKPGQLGIIPGSMGTGSFIVRGRGSHESWQSCSHGAGRSMSRAHAFRNIDQQAFVKHMKDRGIVWDSRYANKVKDEAPMAYKDLSEVMRNQDTLVDIVHRLQPLVNMKGW